MESIVYDFAIVGAGAAGLHLALAMNDDPFFADKSILILEPDLKNKNDRTWCFWEKGKGQWDQLLTKSWPKALFNTTQRQQSLDLGDYQYKMIRSLDFYNYTKRVLTANQNINWVNKSVNETLLETPHKIRTSQGYFFSHQVFDSRITPGFYNYEDKHIRLLQHFKGRIIETQSPAFESDTFTMMDFRVKWKNSCSFTYVLPLSANQALVEFTFFSPQLVGDAVYDQMLDEYIREHLGIKDYNLLEVEKGVIPMSNFPFHRENTDTITKIGTAGGWVKPSSGYSFKNAERMSKKIVENLKNNRTPSKGLFKKRFRKYDALFLDVLYNHNDLGERIFTDMYHKNSAPLIFAFLDEQTTLSEDVKIIKSFEWWPFTKALLKSLT